MDSLDQMEHGLFEPSDALLAFPDHQTLDIVVADNSLDALDFDVLLGSANPAATPVFSAYLPEWSTQVQDNNIPGNLHSSVAVGIAIEHAQAQVNHLGDSQYLTAESNNQTQPMTTLTDLSLMTPGAQEMQMACSGHARSLALPRLAPDPFNIFSVTTITKPEPRWCFLNPSP
jgi:hypothetical protein